MEKKDKKLGLSLIVAIYKNEENLDNLSFELERIATEIEDFEVVFVIDGSPDNCENILKNRRKDFSFSSKIVVHSRNFGSQAAVKTGLIYSSKEISAILSADLQEPTELILKFYRHLQSEDVFIAFGLRLSRDDGLIVNMTSKTYWKLYSLLINRDIPKGGVDIFAIKTTARNQLLEMSEKDSFLIAQLFWLGYARVEVPYNRQKRLIGKSQNTFKKRLNYMANSVFNFTALPINLITFLGLAFLIVSFVYSLQILYLALAKAIPVPGFATLVLIMLTGFGVNFICLSVLGAYIWRTFKNTQKRPDAIVKKIY